MKTIDVKSMLIGFLLCACFFLTVGATDEVESMQWNVDGKVIVEDVEGNLIIDSNNGRYQLSTCTNNTYVEETIIDTRTGKIISRESLRVKGHYSTIK